MDDSVARFSGKAERALGKKQGKSVVGANIRGNLAEKKGEETFLKERMHKRTPGDQKHQEKCVSDHEKDGLFKRKWDPTHWNLECLGEKSECEVRKLRQVVED